MWDTKLKELSCQYYRDKTQKTPPTLPVMEVKCSHLRREALSASQLMLKPNQEAPWPEGIAIREQLIQIPCQHNCKILVTVEILTDHDIAQCGRMTLGWLSNVDSVSLLETVN
ncbi:hypothetical protein AMECASPLE_023789 [Ameca splendens]|uniref:Uncharacterized protein n=1 Tax=Ameca splendens TaxID=208324 RepID=A0ABV0Y448_9TELE